MFTRKILFTLFLSFIVVNPGVASDWLDLSENFEITYERPVFNRVSRQLDVLVTVTATQQLLQQSSRILIKDSSSIVLNADGTHSEKTPYFNLPVNLKIGQQHKFTVSFKLVRSRISFTPKIVIEDPIEVLAFANKPNLTINQFFEYQYVPEIIADFAIAMFAIENEPDWLTLNPITGELVGTPVLEDTGQFKDIKISVTDIEGNSAELQFSLVVNAAPMVTLPQKVTLQVSPEVTLDASGATDEENHSFIFSWVQTRGAHSILTGADTAVLKAEVSDSTDGSIYTFELSLTDELGAKSTFSIDVITNLDTAKPTPAQIVALSSTDMGSFIVSWFPGQDDKTPSNTLKYEIHGNDSAGYTPDSTTLLKTVVGKTSAIVNGVDSAAELYIALVTKDVADNTSFGSTDNAINIADRAPIYNGTLIQTAENLGIGAPLELNSRSGVLTFAKKTSTNLPINDGLLAGKFDSGRGFLVRILGVAEFADTFEISVESATLTDAYSEFVISNRVNALPPPIDETPSGAQLSRTSSGNNHSNVVWDDTYLTVRETTSSNPLANRVSNIPYLTSQNSSATVREFTTTIASSLEISGSIDFTPVIDANVSVKAKATAPYAEIERASFKVQGFLALNGQLEYLFDAKKKVNETKTIYSRDFETLFWVGLLPVYQVVTLELKVAFKGEAFAKMDVAANVNASANIKFEGVYTGGEFNTVYTDDFSGGAAVDVELAGGMTGTIHLIPAIKVSYYEALSAGANVDTNVTGTIEFKEYDSVSLITLEASTFQSLEVFDITLGSQLNGFVDLSFLGKEIVKFDNNGEPLWSTTIPIVTLPDFEIEWQSFPRIPSIHAGDFTYTAQEIKEGLYVELDIENTEWLGFPNISINRGETYLWGPESHGEENFVYASVPLKGLAEADRLVRRIVYDYVDLDADSIPNVWEDHYGMDIYDPTDADLDYEPDGLTNLEEYIINSDPRAVTEIGECPWETEGYPIAGSLDEYIVIETREDRKYIDVEIKTTYEIIETKNQFVGFPIEAEVSEFGGRKFATIDYRIEEFNGCIYSVKDTRTVSPRNRDTVVEQFEVVYPLDGSPIMSYKTGKHVTIAYGRYLIKEETYSVKKLDASNWLSLLDGEYIEYSEEQPRYVKNYGIVELDLQLTGLAFQSLLIGHQREYFYNSLMLKKSFDRVARIQGDGFAVSLNYGEVIENRYNGNPRTLHNFKVFESVHGWVSIEEGYSAYYNSEGELERERISEAVLEKDDTYISLWVGPQIDYFSEDGKDIIQIINREIIEERDGDFASLSGGPFKTYFEEHPDFPLREGRYRARLNDLGKARSHIEGKRTNRYKNLQISSERTVEGFYNSDIHYFEGLTVGRSLVYFINGNLKSNYIHEVKFFNGTDPYSLISDGTYQRYPYQDHTLKINETWEDGKLILECFDYLDPTEIDKCVEHD